MTTIKAIGKELVLKADQNISLYPQQNIWIGEGTKLIFEGTVPDNFEAKLQATSVTADRDIILPDSDGTIATQEWVNLQGFGGGGGGSSAITIQDEGSSLSTAATTINFVGTGVVASGTGATKTITISSGSGIAEVSSDTTPQLGGDLDLNSNNITGTGDINIAGTITSTAAGTPTLTSSTDINLQAGTGAADRVEVIQSPFKVASFTTTQRDTKTSENGDIIYNTTDNKFQGYATSAWEDLQGSVNSVQQISGPGAISLATPITEITTTGADSYTLADGVIGQTKIIIMIVDGGDATITPTTFATGTTITMADVNDNITLLYGANGWVNTANQGSIIA